MFLLPVETATGRTKYMKFTDEVQARKFARLLVARGRKVGKIIRRM